MIRKHILPKDIEKYILPKDVEVRNMEYLRSLQAHPTFHEFIKTDSVFLAWRGFRCDQGLCHAKREPVYSEKIKMSQLEPLKIMKDHLNF